MPLRYQYRYTVNEPPAHPSEASKFLWTSPTGRVTDLANFDDPTSGICVAPGATGLGMLPPDYYETESPVFDGSTFRGFRYGARQIDLPIQMWGANRRDLLRRWRQFVADIKPSLFGPGLLTLRQFDGESRSIEAYYAGGLDGQDDDETWGPSWIRAVITLRCPSPYWLGVEQARSFGIAGASDEDPLGPSQLFLPILPLRLAGGLPTVVVSGDDDALSVSGTITVDNDGDGPIFPLISFTGPCGALTLRNTNTGSFFTVSNGVAAGKTLTIDTRPGFSTVLEITPGANEGHSPDVPDPTVVNRYSDLAAGSELWSLTEGENVIAIAAPAVTAASNLRISWNERFLTGY